MKKKTGASLEELLRVLGLQSDTTVRCLLKSILKDSKTTNLLQGLQMDVEPSLGFNKKRVLPNLLDEDELRKIFNKLECRIEAIVEKILCLLEKFQHRKELKPQERKQLLKSLLALIQLLNLKNFLESLKFIVGKGK